MHKLFLITNSASSCKQFQVLKLSNLYSRSFCKSAIKYAKTSQSNATSNTVTPCTILVEKDANITLIGINREQQRNSIDETTAIRLSEAIQQFETDDTSPVGVLYGVGGSFSAGYDVIEFEAEAKRGSLNFLLRHEGAVGPTRRHLRKPIICGISGFCVANGLELALLCDLRVMEDTAVLGFFNRRLGVPLSDGGSVRLAAAVGYSNAIDIVETGRRVYAREALRIGLTNRTVATGTSLGQAVNLAFSIAKFPMAALQHDRHAVLANTNIYARPGFRKAISNEIMSMTATMVSDMQEGVKRFKTSDTKGSKTDAWHVKERTISDWEKAEISIEQKKKTNGMKCKTVECKNL